MKDTSPYPAVLCTTTCQLTSARFDTDSNILRLELSTLSCICPSFFNTVGVFFTPPRLKVKATEREKQEEERGQTQNEDNRHATRHQVHDCNLTSVINNEFLLQLRGTLKSIHVSSRLEVCI